MPISASVGQAFGLDGREASARAIREALGQIDRERVGLAMLFASHEYEFQHILGGSLPLLGESALIGFSTSGEITADHGRSQRSVVAALLAGEGLDAQAAWWALDSEKPWLPLTKTQNEADAAHAGSKPLLLLSADGLLGDCTRVLGQLPSGDYSVAGCLSGGSIQHGKTYQIGGAEAGQNGVAAARIAGQLRFGIGVAHGWQPVGSYYQVTRSQGPWVRALDGRPSAEIYASLFGFRAREWAFPPLNELIRLYPLGIEGPQGDGLLVRSALRVEADGSLRMNIPVPEGSTCHLLIGSVETCLKAAGEATRSALAQLGDAQPILVLVFMDTAWGALLQGRTAEVVQIIRAEIGSDTPIAGAYGFGQFARTAEAGEVDVLNQHIEVVIIGG